MTASSIPESPTLAHETTPLLGNNNDSEILKHDLIYQRFSPSQRRFILGLVSWCGILPLFVSNVFAVSIPTIARDFHTTSDVISLSVSLSIVCAALGSMTCAVYSSYYGRRPAYLWTLPLFIMGSFGVVFATTVPQLMIFRGLQTLGAAPGITVGGGVIADIYRLEERGWAMGVFFAFVLLGPAVAPVLGGLAAHYSDWRMMHIVLIVVGVIAFILIAALFPETSQPGERGIDKQEAGSTSQNPKKFILLNPFKVLSILQSPNFLLVTLCGAAVLLAEYVLFIPLAETFATRYNITNDALLGVCFTPVGLGNILGAPLAGRISDTIVSKWKAKRGEWYPEDRLRATLPGIGLFVPIALVVSGASLRFLPGGPLGLSIVLVCMFFIGLGVDFTLTPMSAYCADILHSRSAESMAASMGFRALLLGLLSAGIFPSIHTIGSFWTHTITAAASCAGYILMLLVIRYGEQMRRFKDIGYSTAATN